MPDRSSVAHQQATLTVGGRTYSGWQTVEIPDRDLPTGSYIPGGRRGAVATVGVARPTGVFTLAKKYDAGEYASLGRAIDSLDVDGTVVVSDIDVDGRIVGASEPATGVLVGRSRSGIDRASGEPKMMTARFNADGA